MKQQTRLDPQQQEWIEVQQAYLRKQVKEDDIQSDFNGSDTLNLRKWLFRVTSKTMKEVTPLEKYGRVVLTEFYPDEELNWSGQTDPSVDPVLPVPLIDELINDQTFVNAFRRLYRTQQEFSLRGGPDSAYGGRMLAQIDKIAGSSLNNHLSEREYAYFWDTLLDVCARPFEYLDVEQEFEWKSWHLAALFVTVMGAAYALLSLIF